MFYEYSDKSDTKKVKNSYYFLENFTLSSKSYKSRRIMSIYI